MSDLQNHSLLHAPPPRLPSRVSDPTLRPPVLRHPTVERVATSITVVIPTLNEAALVGRAIASVTGEASEVMVVDGGSTDTTRRVAAEAGARVLAAPRGRGAQLEAGAREATGEWLVFLHADTWLERGWSGALRGLDGAVVGGAFRFSLDSPRVCYRIVEAGVRLRCATLGLPFGDQALFVRRQIFEWAGGFGRAPILEDVDFVRRLRRHGRLAFPAVLALTSARRWEERGLVRTTLLNWLVLGLDAAGWPRDRLAQLYRVRGS
jgi:rSAM/selenodomain-associated transferase 2